MVHFGDLDVEFFRKFLMDSVTRKLKTTYYPYPCGRLKPATRIPPQPSHIETPTHIETRTHNQFGDKIEKSQAPDDGCINVRNMSSREEVK